MNVFVIHKMLNKIFWYLEGTEEGEALAEVGGGVVAGTEDGGVAGYEVKVDGNGLADFAEAAIGGFVGLEEGGEGGGLEGTGDDCNSVGVARGGGVLDVVGLVGGGGFQELELRGEPLHGLADLLVTVREVAT